jgi:hypothetical protein
LVLASSSAAATGAGWSTTSTTTTSAELLEQAISHVEHVRGGLARTASAERLAEA